MTPIAIALAGTGPEVLAVGAFLKSAACATRGNRAFLAPPGADLDSAPSRIAFDEMVERLLDALAIEPAVVAHDLHPDFHSTRFAQAFARRRGVPALAVQHHHAHIAAVAAEHGEGGPLIGIAMDGFGLGTDGAAWGGELLRVERGTSRRIGHLRELCMPGGDLASREPWRMAASALHAMGRGGEISHRFPGPAGRAVASMLERGLNVPRTSSAGRWFDAAAGLLGVCRACEFEAQAAIELERLATVHGPAAPAIDGFVLEEDGRLDLLPLLERLEGIGDPAQGAALFHSTLSAALAQWACAAAARESIGTVALGGGCFANRLLATQLRARLQAGGLQVLQPGRLPPGDAALAFGQAAVAQAALSMPEGR